MGIRGTARPHKTFQELQLECVQLKERVRRLEQAVLDYKAKLFEANERNRELERKAAQ